MSPHAAAVPHSHYPVLLLPEFDDYQTGILFIGGRPISTGVQPEPALQYSAHGEPERRFCITHVRGDVLADKSIGGNEQRSRTCWCSQHEGLHLYDPLRVALCI